MQHRPKTTVYVAQGIDGLVKVGLTSDGPQREKHLAQVFREKGDKIAHFHYCADVADPFDVEDALIRFCNETYDAHSGFEWFVGDGDFDALKAAMARFIDQNAARFQFPEPTPEQIRAWQLRDERERRIKAERLARYATRRDPATEVL